MKFDCGDRGKAKIARMKEWHRWFAWRPIRLADHDCRWLEVVERKGTYHSLQDVMDPFSWWAFEYRPLSEAGEG